MPRFEYAELTQLESFVDCNPTVAQLHGRFLEEYGHAYNDMPPRFAQAPGTLDAFTREKFEHTLGIDVAHDTHPISQWLIAKHMIPHLNLLPTDSQRLLLTAITHDYGEAITGRDIVKGQATLDDLVVEQNAWDLAINTIGGTFTDRIFTEVRPILTGQNEHLHSIFSVSETIGYVATGLRAGRIAFNPLAEGFDEPQIAVLHSIALSVRKISGDKALAHRHKHPHLDQLITNHQTEWDISTLALQTSDE
jgi:hypothetical protein